MIAPTAIDLSRLPAPQAIEPLDFEALFAAFRDRFGAAWTIARERDPTLPSYDVGALETDPVVIVGQAWSYLRLLDRARVNDAIRAVLAPLANRSDLDAVVARQNLARLETAPGVPETDAQLLNRYLLSFDMASAGSASRLLFDAYTAWPAMAAAAVNGWAIHGRRGETDVVIAGADGITLPESIAAVRAAVTGETAKPEAIGVSVLPAERLTYTVTQVIRVPVGPDAELVRQEAESRVRAATAERALIGATVPRDLLAGAAYGPSIVGVDHMGPAVDVVASPYQIPICTAIDIAVEIVT